MSEDIGGQSGSELHCPGAEVEAGGGLAFGGGGLWTGEETVSMF